MDEVIIVGGLIEKDGKILLVKAKVGIPKGLWNLPSGHVDEEETVPDAAVREAEEKTGLKCEIEGFVGFYQKIRTGLPKENNVVRVIYKLKVLDGELKFLEDEIEEAKWMSKEEISNMPDDVFASATKEAILDFLERGFSKQNTYLIRNEGTP